MYIYAILILHTLTKDNLIQHYNRIKVKNKLFNIIFIQTLKAMPCYHNHFLLYKAACSLHITRFIIIDTYNKQ